MPARRQANNRVVTVFGGEKTVHVNFRPGRTVGDYLRSARITLPPGHTLALDGRVVSPEQKLTQPGTLTLAPRITNG